MHRPQMLALMACDCPGFALSGQKPREPLPRLTAPRVPGL